MSHVLFIGMRGKSALRWCNEWYNAGRALGATRVASRDVTRLHARFHEGVDMEDVVDALMARGFAVNWYDNVVEGFPSSIQDPATGEPTRFEGLDR